MVIAWKTVVVPQINLYKIKTAEVGDIIICGSYEQDGNVLDGKEDIEWLVLAKEENKILVISCYGLDCKQYNTSETAVTWETCSLRKWLNGTFINDSFSSAEQNIIQNTTVTADRNPEYGTNPGNATNDRVFLLSINEANKYFSSSDEREYKYTEHTKYPLANISDSKYWWLRSPGNEQDSAAVVKHFYPESGYISEYGMGVNFNDIAVRPAMWISV